MTFNADVDVTPISQPPALYASVDTSTPFTRAGAPGNTHTSFVVFADQGLTKLPLAFIVTGEVDSAGEQSKAGEPPTTEQLSDIGRTANARMLLLARKYAGLDDNDQRARLEILTQRMRRLAPRVTAGDVEALEAGLEAIQAREARRAEIAALYGRP